MNCKLQGAMLDRVVALANEGKRLYAISEATGIGCDALSRFLRARGFKIVKGSRPGPKRTDLCSDDIVAAYQAGSGLPALVKRFGAGRGTLTTILRCAGVAFRNGSDANLIRFSLSSPEMLREQMKSARAMRRTNLLAASLDPAKTRYDVGVGYHVLRQALQDAGLPVQMQVPFLTYYLDMLIGKLAVEVVYKTSHVFNHINTRVIRLAESKQTVTYIVHDGEPSLIKYMDYIVVSIKQTCANPPRNGQYRLIRCSLDKGISDVKYGRFSHVFRPVYSPDITWVK